MDISKHKTLLIVLIAILWIACIITGTTGHFVLGMCLGVALMFLHMILGVAKQGKVSKQFLLYPLLIWCKRAQFSQKTRFLCQRCDGCKKMHK